MGKVLGIVIVIAIVAALVLSGGGSGGGGKIMDKITGSSYADDASRRVTAILKDMAGGRGAESHLATTLWERNARTMDQGELDAAHRAFTDFRRPRSFDGPFSTYRVVSSEEVEGEPVKTALVTFEVNGKTYRWLVPEKSRIRWAGK